MSDRAGARIPTGLLLDSRPWSRLWPLLPMPDTRPLGRSTGEGLPSRWGRGRPCGEQAGEAWGLSTRAAALGKAETGREAEGSRSANPAFQGHLPEVLALWDRGNQQLELDCDRDVWYLALPGNGEGSLRRRDSSQDKPARAQGCGFRRRGCIRPSGPQADPSPGRHPAHQHGNDRDLRLGPGIAGSQLCAQGAVIWSPVLRALTRTTGTPTPRHCREDQQPSRTLGLRVHTEPGSRRGRCTGPDPTAPKRRCDQGMR